MRLTWPAREPEARAAAECRPPAPSAGRSGRAPRAGLGETGRSTRPGCARPPAARGSRSSSPPRRSRGRTAAAAADNAPSSARRPSLPASLAALRSAISPISAPIACSRISQWRSWICSTRSLSSFSVTFASCLLWQRDAGGLEVEHRAAHPVIAHRRAFVEIFGMWQSTQVTPARAWMPWFHNSNSGCCAFNNGAPVSLCVQSRKPISS